ncbi:YceD family protein [Sphingomonas sp. MMS12-HWE2-04]|uniref:YceD family protein n=1 Tax=Sphingomonas sp. MMS12-HWE2-04 TaxID=3234199 RepID=UPI00384A835B
MTVEFPRPHRLDQIGSGESQSEIHAEPEERAALARRFDLKTIESLDARYTLQSDAIGVVAKGHLSARVTQSCIVTDEPVPAVIEEDFAIRFVPETSEAEGADEFELSEDECDTVFYSGSAIDLGEAAAETLALALDPYPRSPNAAAALKAAGVISEEEAGPFGALAGLKDKLAGK